MVVQGQDGHRAVLCVSGPDGLVLTGTGTRRRAHGMTKIFNTTSAAIALLLLASTNFVAILFIDEDTSGFHFTQVLAYQLLSAG